MRKRQPTARRKDSVADHGRRRRRVQFRRRLLIETLESRWLLFTPWSDEFSGPDINTELWDISPDGQQVGDADSGSVAESAYATIEAEHARLWMSHELFPDEGNRSVKLASELTARNESGYGLYRGRMRAPTGGDHVGLTAGFFTYRTHELSGDNTVQEIDIELFGEEHDLVHFTVWYNSTTGARISASCPVANTEQWHSYGFLWSDEAIQFMVGPDHDHLEIQELDLRYWGWDEAVEPDGAYGYLPLEDPATGLQVSTDAIRPEHFEWAYGVSYLPDQDQPTRLILNSWVHQWGNHTPEDLFHGITPDKAMRDVDFDDVSYVPALEVSGHVQYRGLDATLHNAARVKVEVWEDESPSAEDIQLAEGWTDEDGKFLINRDLNGQVILNWDLGAGQSGSRDIYLKLIAENEAAKVQTPGVWGSVFEYRTETIDDVLNSSLVFDPIIWDTAQTPDHAEAFGIPAAMWDDNAWFQEQVGWNQPQVTVVYPHSSPIYARSDYDPISNRIRLVENWRPTATHEYAHAVHDTVLGDVLLLPGWDPRISDHNWWTESNPGFALTEGWAEFVKFAHDLPDSPTLETNNFWMGEDEVGGTNPNFSLGVNVEGAVASILWDLWDGVNDDAVDSRFADLWTVFSLDRPQSIWNRSGNRDFYHAWNRRFGQSRAVDEIFIDHGIPVTDDQFRGNYSRWAAQPLNDLQATYDDLILAYDRGGVGSEDWFSVYLPSAALDDSTVSIQYDARGAIDLAVYRLLPEGDLIPACTVIPEPDPDWHRAQTCDLSGQPLGLYFIRVYSAAHDMSPNYSLSLNVDAPGPGVDVVTVIDRSGSMAGEKITLAKNAAQMFVGLMKDGDKIGVASYAGSGSVDFPLTEITTSVGSVPKGSPVPIPS